jgi:hypothetical protein
MHALGELMARIDAIEARAALTPEPVRHALVGWVGQVRAQAASVRTSPNLGFPLVPVVLAVGGSVLLIGGAAFGNWLRDVFGTTKRIEVYLDCLERLRAQGFPETEAERRCSQLSTPVPAWMLFAIGAAMSGLLAVLLLRRT